MAPQGKMDCFVASAPRNDVGTHLRHLAAQIRASFAGNVPPSTQRARGMPGAQCARSLVCEIKKHTSKVTTVTPENTRHSPRNGFNGFLRALPGDRACLPPSSAEYFRQLDASVGAS